MISFKLAFRNLVGAGLRTWLTGIVLSFSFVVIIWNQGLLDGWNRQARRDMVDWEIGGGQYWHQNYDPYDPFTISDSHTKLPEKLQIKADTGLLTPILVSQAAIYPEGRMQSILLKGIDPVQQILKLPSNQLQTDIVEIPVLIGTRMADHTRLNRGDVFTIRWRDVNGTFDAAEATIIVTDPGFVDPDTTRGWVFRDHNFLLAEIDQIIKRKTIGGSILYIILLLLAMLAIFDTQVLSVFRRQKEIGTHIAMGMTRGQVIRLFTVEGAMHGILAALIAAAYGIPLLSLQAVHGFPMPGAADQYGLVIAEKIFPVYSIGLVFGTAMIVFITTTVVSFLPAKKIAKMKPADAIKGKVQ
jgi:putative ABC transport system permease protein